MKRIFLMVFIIFILLISTAYATEYEIIGEDFFNETVNSTLNGTLNLNPITLINKFLKSIFLEIVNSKQYIKSILVIAAASGILKILSDSFEGCDVSEIAFFACFIIMSILIINIFKEAVGYGVTTIHSLCDFITKFEPIFISLLATSGAVTGAAVFQPILSLSVYLLGLIVDNFILPITYFSAILGIINSISGRIEIGTLTKLLSSVSKWALMGLLTLFTAILSIYGFGTSALNTVAVKGLKFAVGSLVPVVGGILSDTVDTVLSGASLIKNAVGTAGMITVISVTFFPIIKLFIIMTLLHISAAFVEPFSDKRITSLILSTYDAAKNILSMVITASLLFIISIGIILLASGVSF